MVEVACGIMVDEANDLHRWSIRSCRKGVEHHWDSFDLGFDGRWPPVELFVLLNAFAGNSGKV